MTNEVKIQHPAIQTRLPDHEQTARKHRAAAVGLPRPQRPPKPPAHPLQSLGARRTWHVAWPDPSGKDEGKQEFQTPPQRGQAQPLSDQHQQQDTHNGKPTT